MNVTALMIVERNQEYGENSRGIAVLNMRGPAQLYDSY